ncbi:E3 ubiquitin-protein ligase RSL1-like [Lolium rigidum]|uniref:E3 ubiquitin-protein ligase RSL1-like n=1 Tax=Lolium rigidum TaxID=89674 RepID=UPI001F5C4B55|nr:E3 ubiquitin-protein ligase RSL1-like [Lolium rigidum]
MAGDGDLAAFRRQVALPSDLDFAFQLQPSEAIEASLRVRTTPNRPSPSAAAATACCSYQPAPAHWSSEAAFAALARQEKNRREAQAFRAAHAQANTSARVASRGALLARELADTTPDGRWAHGGDLFERPHDLNRPPLFRVFYKGLLSNEGMESWSSVLAVAVYDPRGKVVGTIQKPVEGFAGGRMELEVLALKEGIIAALKLGIRSINIVSDFKPLHNYMLGTWRPTKNKSEDMVNEALSLMRKFEQCEFSLVPRGQVGYATKLATDLITNKSESCTICLGNTDISKIHAVEGCGHRFCVSCMKEHVKVKLRNGMLPACPQDGCTTKLTVKGSKIFLSPQLLEIMVQRIREGQIPAAQKIYCPYSRCSALMSLSEVIHPLQESSSMYTVVGAATLRKCVKCRGSFCISCKVPWHDRISCYDYKRRYPHAHPEDTKLQKLARKRLWRQCVQCNHMIELAEGCYHMTCVCSCQFCYTCGKEWKNNKASCFCRLVHQTSSASYYANFVRPVVAAEAVARLLCDTFELQANDFSVHLHQPEDFLIIFGSQHNCNRISGDHFLSCTDLSLNLRP